MLGGVCLGQVLSLVRGHIREVRVSDASGGESPSVWTFDTLSAAAIFLLSLYSVLQPIQQLLAFLGRQALHVLQDLINLSHEHRFISTRSTKLGDHIGRSAQCGNLA